MPGLATTSPQAPADATLVSTQQPDRNASLRRYQCPMCPRAFMRSEHCVRHARRHTQEKPYSCRYCARRYSRKDLVTRHEKSLHADQHQPRPPERKSTDGGPRNAPDQLVESVSNDATSSANLQVEYLLAGPDPPLSPPPSSLSATGRQSVDDDQSQVSPLSHGGNTGDNGQRKLSGNIANIHDDFDETSMPVAVAPPNQQNDNTSHQLNLNYDPGGLLTLDALMGFEGLSAGMTTADGFPPLPFFDTFLVDSFANSPRYTPAPDMPNLGNLGQPPANHHQAVTPTQGGFNITGPSISASSPTLPPPRVIDDDVAQRPMVGITDALIKRLLPPASPAFDAVGDETIIAATIAQCLRLFFEVFNFHLPIFHTPSLNLTEQPTGLLLAMAAIGALYRLERRMAALLFLEASRTHASDRHSGHVDLDLFDDVVPHSSVKRRRRGPRLAEVQTSLLLHFFAMFSGNEEVVEKSFITLSELEYGCYALIRQARSHGTRPLDGNDWHAWVARESVNRVVHGMCIFSNLVSATYGVAPPNPASRDQDVAMPCSDALWHAQTHEEWRELWLRSSDVVSMTIKTATSLLWDHEETFSGSPNESRDWSPFAAVVLMHSIAIQLRHVSCRTESWHSSPFTEHRSLPKHDNLTLFRSALDRCRSLVASSGGSGPSQFSHTKEKSLLFNAFAALRMCYGRTVPALAQPQRDGLLRSSSDDLAAAVTDFIDSPLERGPEVTYAVSFAFEGLCLPLHKGVLLVRKTAALSWSVEHAIAGWDSVLIVSKWLHATCSAQAADSSFIDEEEQRLLDRITLMIRRADGNSSAVVRSSLAARLTRYWASFYDDTWVWGVSPRMASVLRQMAVAYDASANQYNRVARMMSNG